MSLRLLALTVTVVLAFPLVGRAQVRPFFPAGAGAFTPQIDVVNSGVLNDVEATVSPDRKYVTLGMRPSNAQLLALHEFAFGGIQVAGFVGGALPNGVNAAGAFGVINPPLVLGQGKAAALFAQRGMTPVINK